MMVIMATMRINLVTPFAEKDAVKALGARWDGAKKVWYVVDVPDLAPFMRWIPDLAKATDPIGEGASQKPPFREPAKAAQGVITVSTVELPSCGCKSLPWEHCEHSAATK